MHSKNSTTMTAELNCILIKINGFDVSNLTQNETVQMFLAAQREHLLIEVQRRCADDARDDTSLVATGHKTVAYGAAATSSADDAAIVGQKQHGALNADNSSKGRTGSVPPLVLTLKMPASSTSQISTKSTQTDHNDSFLSTQQREQQEQQQQQKLLVEQQQLANKQHAERLIEEEHNLFEQCLAPELDIEEITLRKSASNERLGLTVCYSMGDSNNSNGSSISNIGVVVAGFAGTLSNSDDNDACMEVYISDIQPDSIAGRDGRLRQGDQILQINGKDVKDKDESEALIAENCNAVTLLVSRYLYVDDDDFNDPSSVADDVDDDDDVAEEQEEEDDVVNAVEYDDDDDVDVDDDEVDEGDDEDVYYDESNLAYENCCEPTQNKFKNAVAELDKVLLLQAAQQQQQQLRDPELKLATSLTSENRKSHTARQVNADVLVKDTSSNACKSTYEAHCDAVKLPQGRPASAARQKQKPYVSKQATKATTVAVANSSGLSAADYDTEHIYETIPEDSESEPFYCSPYESSMYVTAAASSCAAATEQQQCQQQQQQQKMRVAQWLGLKASPLMSATSGCKPPTVARLVTGTFVGGSRSAQRNDTVHSVITTLTNGSSSSGGTNGTGSCNGSNGLTLDERDNSSSAYNTGGSNNSGSPFILQLGQPQQQPRNILAVDGEPAQLRNSKQQQRLQSPKEQKIPSPKNSALLLLGGSKGGGDMQPYSPKNVYINDSNSHHTYQAMWLQQHLYRQQQQEQQLPPQTHALHFPTFTAPNLSQYHFVSSQEVSSTLASGVPAAGSGPLAGHNAAPPVAGVLPPRTRPLAAAEETTTMVWKVKRRPDGTRYIVRRPAGGTTTTTAAATTTGTEAQNSSSAAAAALTAPRGSRLVRADRTLRIRMRNNDNNTLTTTTEDDTISEVKTGRYWSKEERKKHIERARERRQQHLQLQQHLQQQQQQHGDSSFATTMRIAERVGNKLLPQKVPHQQRLHEQQQHGSRLLLSRLAAATTTKPLRPKSAQQHSVPQQPLQEHYQLHFKSMAATGNQQPAAATQTPVNDMLLASAAAAAATMPASNNCVAVDVAHMRSPADATPESTAATTTAATATLSTTTLLHATAAVAEAAVPLDTNTTTTTYQQRQQQLPANNNNTTALQKEEHVSEEAAAAAGGATRITNDLLTITSV